MRAPSLRLALLGTALVVGSGCGHPATESECRTLVDKMIEVELAAQGVTDRAELEKRRLAALDATGKGPAEDVFRSCLGKRVTDGAMACVAAAKSADDITERCLR